MHFFEHQSRFKRVQEKFFSAAPQQQAVKNDPTGSFDSIWYVWYIINTTVCKSKNFQGLLLKNELSFIFFTVATYDKTIIATAAAVCKKKKTFGAHQIVISSFFIFTFVFRGENGLCINQMMNAEYSLEAKEKFCTLCSVAWDELKIHRIFPINNAASPKWS